MKCLALTDTLCRDALATEAETVEALFSEPTSRTPRFDDYTPDSYHIQKEDLVDGLIKQSIECGLKLRAILIVGPVGMLWAYHVATFVVEGDRLRVNLLTMPHARSTEKGTALLPIDAGVRVLHDISISPRIIAGRPKPAIDNPEGSREFSYNLLIVDLDGVHAGYYHARLSDIVPADDDKEIFSHLSRLGDMTTTTYRHGDPVPAAESPQ